ncbi:elongation factor 1-gamma-like [Sturnira hondurensis]|uniref:elongation factor 1-gamma-like n=1 Tax=Sturnira hondurensis TaxID=192404 RepID=UPI00187A4B9A|nr:elongation factor 1-gamma-like [Sturnira hondurensis]
MDGCERALAAEPEAKEAFAHLPGSTFMSNEFRCNRSGEDTLSAALLYFWGHCDKDGFPKELTQTFMSCNLIAVMLQRSDKLQKQALASAPLDGTNNSSSMSGLWVF